MTLYTNQLEVVHEAELILERWGMVYLALRPRYGKTPISLTLARGKILFVTMRSAFAGVNKVVKELQKPNVTVCTYGTAHKYLNSYDTIILDEAHKNISSYPKESVSREKLQPILDNSPTADIIWLSGTPQIESNSKMFHQLNVSPRHSFSKYDSFYHWFNGSAHYKNKTDKRKGYGITGLVKHTGSNRPAINYDNTINFSEKVDPIMIRRGEEEQLVNIIVHHVRPPQKIIDGMIDIRTKSIAEIDGNTFIADGGAGKLSKQHQLAGGSAISVDGSGILLSDFKAIEIHKKHRDKNCCIFYKYVAEKEILKKYFNKEDLYQIDSNSTGIDLSHYDEMVIYSLTWSGSTYTQVLNRLVNTERKDMPDIHIYITDNSPDVALFRAVSMKHDFNSKYLDR